ncbi:MAG TPA: pilin [Verrucomicrobiae bacterium]|nr:pilin [Verrucomicrobiae bacterium]
MQKTIKKALQALLFVPLLALGASTVVPATNVGAQAAQPCDQNNLSIGSGASCARGNDQGEDLFSESGIFRTITNILLFLVGAISVIMLIIGGIRYVVSNGDQNAVTSAKNTILYAIIGIIVAFLAYAAVNFVTTQLVQGSN